MIITVSITHFWWIRGPCVATAFLPNGVNEPRRDRLKHRGSICPRCCASSSIFLFFSSFSVFFFFNIARCVNPLCSSYLGEKTNKKRAFFLVCLLICFCLSFWSVSSPLSLPGYCCLEGDFSSTLSASCQTLWVRFTCRQTPYVYVWVRMGLCIFLLARLLLQ